MGPHGARNWWYDATEGQRMYNVPADLTAFMVPDRRTGIRGLGASLTAFERSDVQLLMTPAWTAHAQALVLLSEVMNLDRVVGAQLATEVGALGQMLGEINASLPSLDSSKRAETIQKVDDIKVQLDLLNVRLSQALRNAQSSQRTKAVAWTTGAILIAGGFGFWVFSRTKKKSR